MEEITNGALPAVERKVMKKDFSRIGLALTVYLLIVVALQYLLAFILSAAFPAFVENGWYTWVVAYLPQVLIGAPICLFILRIKEPQEKIDQNYGAGNYVLLIIMSISVMYIGNLIGTLITSIFGASNAIQTVVMESNIWANLLFAVILAPIVEELIFRRAIISRLRKYGDKTAILVSALMFGLMHGNLSQFFYAFGLGVLFGYVYTRTGRIRYSLGLHMIINFMGSIAGSLILRLVNGLDLDAISNMNPADYEAMAETLGGQLWQLMAVGLYGITIVGLAIAGMVLLIVRRKRVVLSDATVDFPPKGRGGIIFGNVGMVCYLVVCIAIIVISLMV